MCNRLAIKLVLVPLHGALDIQNRFTSIFRKSIKLSLLISKDFVNGLNLYGIIFSGFIVFDFYDGFQDGFYCNYLLVRHCSSEDLGL